MSSEPGARVLPFPARIPFIESLGFELLVYEEGRAEIAVSPRDEHLNSWSVLHGGVTMTLLDVAMAHAARSPRADAPADARGVVTIEMKTSFMRPGLGRVLARGQVLHRTSSFAFCEASVFDKDEQLIAHATGTFKYLSSLPAGKRHLKSLNASD